MNKWRSVVLWLPLLLGGAAAQGGTWTVYFVFRLATSLPLTLQATPECVAERAAWEKALAAPGTTSGPRLLETYSFVSPLSAGALRQEIGASAQEGEFTATDLPLESLTRPGGGPDPGVWGREFQGRIAPGYHYAVRVYERPNEGEAASVLCVTVRSDSGANYPDSSPPTND